MNFSPELLERLDLEVAIGQAAPARGEFFPSRLEAEAALYDVDSYATWLKARLHEGYSREVPEIVWVPRGSPGYRPVPHLPFADRVVLEALTGLLAQELVDDLDHLGLRSFFAQGDGDRREFERLPLEDPDADFVIQADIASYYEYVDHAQLKRDIIELTSDIELADAIEHVLAETVDRQFGLPQGPRPSDVLADLYLLSVDQRLEQAGITSWRYNDDFLFAAKDLRGSQLLLQELENALRGRGLVLNHAKNRISPRSTYEQWVDTLAQKLQEAAVANVEPGFYGFDPDVFSEVEIGELDIEVIEGLFEQALSDEDPDPYKVNPRIIQQTLPILAKAESHAPLEHLADLAASWSSHARHVSLYLREFIGREDEGEMVSAAAAVLVEQQDLAPWVRGWLLDPLARCRRSTGRAELRGILTDCLLSVREPWFVKGRCAVVLGQRGEVLEQKQFDALFQRAIGPARADFVAAVRLANPEWADRWLGSLDRRDPLLFRIASWSLDEHQEFL